MEYRLRDFNVDDREDAERLAALWNASDAGWPGGFTRGIPETGERVQESERRRRRLAICVVEYGDQIVGYCNLEAQMGQTNTSYVDLLNARPDHHGRGVGKMLLREMVRRATDLGFRQLTLGTWSGNTKAVPLYKKTGFFWVPETNVFMRNFLPAILTLPVAREFFARRDWYDCFERDLAIAPDEILWRGMKVYPYRFRDGVEFFHLMIDAASEGITALETPAFSVACTLPVEEAAAGELCPVTWEFTRRDGAPLEVVLLAEGELGLDLRVQERLVVEREATLAREFRVSPDARPRREGEPGYRIRSTLVVNGQPIVLETGTRVVRAVEIQYGGQGLFPHREERIAVRLRNRLERPLEGWLALDAHPEIDCEEPAQPFTLPARSWTQCEFRLAARAPGALCTRLRLEAGEVRGSRTVAFRAFGSSGAVATVDSEDDESATLEAPGIAVSTRLRGGALHVRCWEPEGSRGLVYQPLAELGPPFAGGHNRPPRYDVHTESAAGLPALALTAPSKEFPGLVVEREVSILGGDLVRVDYRVANTTSAPHSIQLRLTTNPQLHDHVVMPTSRGILREPTTWGGFPDGETDLLAPGSAPEESWIACEEEPWVCGLLWHPGPKVEMTWDRFPNLVFDVSDVPAHSVRALPPVYLFAGTGNWERVRAWWRRLVQPSGTIEVQQLEPFRVLELCAEPAPALLAGHADELHLALRNERGRPLSGRLTLTGSSFQPEPVEFRIEAIDRERPWSASVRVTTPDPTPTAGFIDATLDSGPASHTFRVPVIDLAPGKCGLRCGERGESRASASSGPGDPHPVAVSCGRDGLFGIENGFFTVRIAPAFLGAIVALERDGVNYLHSAYPEPRPFEWQNPWFGGIHPYVGWHGNPRWMGEQFTGEPVERAGRRDFVWHGVRLACEPRHKDLRWLRLEIEYLTLTGSNVVVVATRWINLTSARVRDQGGISAWLQVGGTLEHAVAHWTRHGERHHRRRSEWTMNTDADIWAAVENRITGEAVILVATDPRVHPGVHDAGRSGAHLHATGPIDLPPNGSQERLTWLAVCTDASQFDAYAALAQARELP